MKSQHHHRTEQYRRKENKKCNTVAPAAISTEYGKNVIK